MADTCGSFLLKGLVFITAVALTGCVKRTGVSKVKHDAGRFTNDSSSYQWIDLSREEIINAVIKPNFHDGYKGALPATHPLSKRLQFYVDAFDATLRQQAADQVRGAPKPKVLVADLAVPNAFVAAVNICTRLQAGVTRDKTERKERYVVDRRQGRLTAASALLSECVTRAFSPAEEEAFAKWALAGTGKCNARVSGGFVSLTSDCGLESNKAAPLTLLATANWIVMDYKLAKALGEDDVAMVLAHELGHYYMAHGVTPANQYNFFYRLGEHNPAARPTPDPRMKGFEEKVKVAVEKFKASKGAFNTVDGQKWHSSIFAATRSLASYFKTACTGVACEKACTELHKLVSPIYGGAQFGAFPREELPTKAKAPYQQYETLLPQCVQTLELAMIEAEVMSGSQLIPFNLVADAFEQILSPDAHLPMRTALKGKTVGEAFSSLNQEMPQIADGQEGPSDAFIELLHEDIGWYTMEQEADEVGMELAARAGFDPGQAVTAQLNLLKILPTLRKSRRAVAGEISYEDCEELLKADWREPSGEFRPVPIADFADEHHTGCFRVFNLSREIKAHRMKASGSAKPVPKEGPGWQSLFSMPAVFD